MPEIEPLPHNILFKKYEVGRLIGCGTFAKVYHGRELLSGHSVAIKVINKNKLSNIRLIDNMKREIAIMSRLNHPYIVKLYEVLATKTKIFLVMEFAKCGELFAKVAKGRLSEDLSRKYFQQLISALAYCHARGVFHRDLKPENLMIDENGNMKVADFGLSAVSEQIRPDRLLHTMCGTPAYVAPEVLSKKGYSGAKVDVWSCGIILFVLSAGYLPFNDPNLMAMYKKIYKGEYRCPKWMSNDLKRFLSRLLDTNSERRITIHGIMQDPWFRKGYKEPKLHVEHLKVVKDEPQVIRLNAFDLISFSSGLNLSGFFNHSPDSTDDGQRFLWKESPDKLVEQVEEIARGEGLMIHRMKQWRVDLEQINENMGIAIEVYRLTDKHFVVEARRTGGDSQCYEDFWKKKIRPLLMENES